MAKYVALLTGAGDGCDYTIDCNKTFKVFEAEDDAAAIKRCKQEWEDRGGAGGKPRIEQIQLLRVETTVNVPVDKWNEQGEADDEKEAAEAELAEIEEKAKKLRGKAGQSMSAPNDAAQARQSPEAAGSEKTNIWSGCRMVKGFDTSGVINLISGVTNLGGLEKPATTSEAHTADFHGYYWTRSGNAVVLHPPFGLGPVEVWQENHLRYELETYRSLPLPTMPLGWVYHAPALRYGMPVEQYIALIELGLTLFATAVAHKSHSSRWYENMSANAYHYEPNATAQAQKSPQAGGSDSDRLDRLLRNMSGAELRRMFATHPRASWGFGGQTMKLYALLQCWYEGDSNLVDDSLLGIFSTVEKAEAAVPHEEGIEVQVFRPGQKVPDDGQYGDKRRRYRIIPVIIDHMEDISNELDPAVSDAAGSDAAENNPAVAQKSSQAGGLTILGEGWFVHCLHDLRGGLWYEGPYDEDVAKSRAAERKAAGGWDEVNVLFLPFVKSEDHVYALWPETAAMTPGVPDNPA